MKAFHESDRHAHPLTPDDWVCEIGAHRGYDSRIFADKYGCKVVAYEPIAEFCDELRASLHGTPYDSLIMPILCGVSGAARRATLGVHGELSGESCHSEKQVTVGLIDIRDVLNNWRLQFGRPPGLLQLNCEGGEYSILLAMLKDDLVRDIPRLKVQFHSVVPDHVMLRAMICELMAVTHDYLWEPSEDFDTTWIGWVRR